MVALLEAFIENPAMFPTALPPKTALYRLFLKIWNSVDINGFPDFNAERPEALRGLQTLTPRPRQAFLLLSLEDFDVEAIAEVLEIDVGEVAALIAAADDEIANQIDPADILIIEDEPLVALQLQAIVSELGHRVIGVARTHKEALALAKRHEPQLILSDIRLADGTSGVEAVNEMLSGFEAPVIFITGHPEMLLTGTKPEPTFLIAKPFQPETVKAVISQAFFFDVRSRINASGPLSHSCQAQLQQHILKQSHGLGAAKD